MCVLRTAGATARLLMTMNFVCSVISMMHVRVYQKAVGANAHALNIRDLTYYDCAANVYETASDRLQFMVQRVQRTLHVG